MYDKQRRSMAMTLGQRIVFLRQKNDISQRELAEKIMVTTAMLSKYENDINIPKSDILSRIADILNTNADYLLGRTDIYYPTSESFSLLDNSESELIDIFRQLSVDNKARILERCLTLKEIQDKR